MNRRTFILKTNAVSLAAFSLPNLLAARAVASSESDTKVRSGILIWLGGGPSHHDTFDPKPNAAAEIRGQYDAIATAVPGVHFAESVPQLAARMKKLAVIRTMTHRQGAHETGSAYMISGYDFRPGHNFASIGGVVSHQRQESARRNGLPPYLAIPDETIRGGGHLGASYNPLSIPGDPNAEDFRVQDMVLPNNLTKKRFLRRRELSRQVNSEFRRTRPADVQQAVDKYTEQAYEMIFSPQAQAAFGR